MLEMWFWIAQFCARLAHGLLILCRKVFCQNKDTSAQRADFVLSCVFCYILTKNALVPRHVSWFVKMFPVFVCIDCHEYDAL